MKEGVCGVRGSEASEGDVAAGDGVFCREEFLILILSTLPILYFMDSAFDVF